jgi:hypothetical protein
MIGEPSEREGGRSQRRENEARMSLLANEAEVSTNESQASGGAFRSGYRIASLEGDLECGGHAAAFERESRFLTEKPAQAMLAPFPIRPLLA